MQIKKMIKAFVSLCMAVSLFTITNVHALEKLDTPQNLAWEDDTYLVWDFVENADSYALEVYYKSNAATSGDLATMIFDTNIGYPSFNVIKTLVNNNLMNPGEYYVKIKATSKNGEYEASEYATSTSLSFVAEKLEDITYAGVDFASLHVFVDPVNAAYSYKYNITDSNGAIVFNADEPEVTTMTYNSTLVKNMIYLDYEVFYNLKAGKYTLNVIPTSLFGSEYDGDAYPIEFIKLGNYSEVTINSIKTIKEDNTTMLVGNITPIEDTTLYLVKWKVKYKENSYHSSWGVRQLAPICGEECNVYMDLYDLTDNREDGVYEGLEIVLEVSPVSSRRDFQIANGDLVISYYDGEKTVTEKEAYANYYSSKVSSLSYNVKADDLVGEDVDVTKPGITLIPAVLNNSAETTEQTIKVNFTEEIIPEETTVEVYNFKKDDEVHDAYLETYSPEDLSGEIVFTTSSSDYAVDGVSTYVVRITTVDLAGNRNSATLQYRTLKTYTPVPVVEQVTSAVEAPTIVANEEIKEVLVDEDGNAFEMPENAALEVKVEEKATSSIANETLAKMEEKMNAITSKIETGIAKLMILDIKLQVKNDDASTTDVNLNGSKKVKVFVPYPDGVTYSTRNAFDLHIFHVHDGNVEKITPNCTLYGMEFEVDKFSDFIITYEEKEVTPPTPSYSGGGSGSSYKKRTKTENFITVEGKMSSSSKFTIGEPKTDSDEYELLVKEIKETEMLLNAYTIKLTDTSGNITVSFPVDAKYEGKQVRVIRVTDETVKKYDVTVSGGLVTFTTPSMEDTTYIGVLVEKSEEEVVTPTLDLSNYSDYKLDIFSNSRVTGIKASANGFTVDGYMWINNIKPTKNTWREIVFVNAEDADMSKAYRKSVTAVYNTFLNSNMIATNNGTLDLSYANYKVEVNPNSIENYTKTSVGKMAAGNYLVYMRISDGKNSYLFPLVDRVLSDGSTMESTNTLPSGFSVTDATERTLVYTVK